MSPRQIRKYCEPDAGGHRLLEVVTEKFGFSARAYTRILKVARTIVDLGGSDAIREQHVAEASTGAWAGNPSKPPLLARCHHSSLLLL